MKTIRLIIPILAACLISCEKKKAETKEVLDLWTSYSGSPNADGAFEITLVASLPTEALPEKREVSFTTSSGTFKESGGNSTKIKAEDMKNPVGKRSAVVTFVAPVKAGPVAIIASIEGYSDTLKFTFSKVVPSNIKTYTDSFSARVNFQSILQLNSQLSSVTGGLPSKGNRVKYIDTDINNKRTLGTFRDSVVNVDDKGQAFAKYSPGLWPSNGFIFIKAIVCTEEGQETTVRDSVRIYLIP